MLTGEINNGLKLAEIVETVKSIDMLESVGLSVGPSNVIEMESLEGFLDVEVSELVIDSARTVVKGWTKKPHAYNTFVLPVGFPAPKIGSVLRVTFEEV